MNNFSQPDLEISRTQRVGRTYGTDVRDGRTELNTMSPASRMRAAGDKKVEAQRQCLGVLLKSQKQWKIDYRRAQHVAL